MGTDPDAHAGTRAEQRATAHVNDQLCFALYAASRAVTGAYRARLGTLGLTYPQYLVLLALWEAEGSTVSSLGRALDLDSGTLSPLVQRLARDGLVRKERASRDERTVRVFSTAAGKALEPRVAAVRREVEASTGLNEAEFKALRRSLHALRATIEASGM